MPNNFPMRPAGHFAAKPIAPVRAPVIAAKSFAPKPLPVMRKRGGRATPKGYFLGGLFDSTPASSSSQTNSTQSTTYDPAYTNLLDQTLNTASNLENTPYTPYTGELVAGLTPDQQASYQAVQNAQGSSVPYTSAAGSNLNTAGGINQSTAAQPYFNNASQMPTASQAAQPYLNQASSTAPSNISNYMSPYTSSVVNNIATLGDQNLTENVLPAISDEFTGGGAAQFGLNRAAYVTDNAIRNNENTILGNQANALESGYNTAGSLYESDANRAATNASTAGGLANTSINTTAGLGTDVANTASATQQGQIATGNAQAGLGTTIQNNALTGASALNTAGTQQQTQQQNVDTANQQQFQNQQNYPFQLLNWAQGVGTGWQLPSTTTGSSTTNATVNPSQGSPFGQVVGGLSALGSLFGPSPTPGNKRGGLIKGYARGGSLKPHFAAGGYAPTVQGIRNGSMQNRRAPPWGNPGAAPMAQPQMMGRPAPMNMQSAPRQLGGLPQAPLANPTPMQPLMRKRGGHFSKRKFAEGGDVPFETGYNHDTAPNDMRAMYRAIEPRENTEYGMMMPVARDSRTGAHRMAMPTMARDALHGALDALAGTKTGNITPDALQAILAMPYGKTMRTGSGLLNPSMMMSDTPRYPQPTYARGGYFGRGR